MGGIGEKKKSPKRAPSGLWLNKVLGQKDWMMTLHIVMNSFSDFFFIFLSALIVVIPSPNWIGLVNAPYFSRALLSLTSGGEV